jgi:hypothetical protein
MDKSTAPDQTPMEGDDMSDLPTKLPRRKALPATVIDWTHVDHALPDMSKRCIVIHRGDIKPAWFGSGWSRNDQAGRFEDSGERIIKPKYWSYWPTIGGQS